LIIYCFTTRSRIFNLYGDVTITGEGFQNLGLCSALRAFEQGRVFIVPHLLPQGPWFFQSHPKDPPPPIQLPLTTHNWLWMIDSDSDHHGPNAFISKIHDLNDKYTSPFIYRIEMGKILKGQRILTIPFVLTLKVCPSI
jgi:hypothetical protein